MWGGMATASLCPRLVRSGAPGPRADAALPFRPQILVWPVTPAGASYQQEALAG